MGRATPIYPPENLAAKNDLITQVRAYTLITPLFGGGVEPGEADPVTVIRASEIRGHLRFWWRATRGGQFGDKLEDMKAAEDALWGAASVTGKEGGGPSLVHTHVVHVQRGRAFVATDRNGRTTNRYGEPIRVGEPNSRDSYAAFPLNDKPGTVLRDQVSFELRLTFPNNWSSIKNGPRFQGTPAEELMAAIWAWETFGGIGARTRRGFGALHCTMVDGHPNMQLASDTSVTSVQAWLTEQLTLHLTYGRWPANIPHLTMQPHIRIVPGRTAPLETWRSLLDHLKNFRQHRNPGQHGSFGRSRWPEADEVRRITRRSLPTHTTPITQVKKFPRAAFGLPLIIQFKRDQWARGGQQGDPPGNNTVKGQLANGDVVERWASPLILRPMATQTGNVGLALVLDGSIMPSPILDTGRQNYTAVSAALTPSDSVQLTRNDNRTALLGGETDVIKAFLNTL